MEPEEHNSAATRKAKRTMRTRSHGEEHKLDRYKEGSETVTRSPGETEQPLSTRRLSEGRALVRVSGSTGHGLVKYEAIHFLIEPRGLKWRQQGGRV